MGSTPAGRSFLSVIGDPCSISEYRRLYCSPITNHWKVSRWRNFLCQCLETVEQVFLARDSNDLVAQLAVLEKKQGRNRANIVLKR